MVGMAQTSPHKMIKTLVVWPEVMRKKKPCNAQSGQIALRNQVCGIMAFSVQCGYQACNMRTSLAYRKGRISVGALEETAMVASNPAM